MTGAGDNSISAARVIPAAIVYTLKQAEPSDITTIRSLLKSAHFDTRGLDSLCFVVAIMSGSNREIIGCAQIKWVGHKRVLSSVVVQRQYRGLGVGRVMIQNLLQREIGSIFLMCIGELIPFYESFGFRIVPPYNAPFGLFWRWMVLLVLATVGRQKKPAIMMRNPLPLETA